METKPNLSWMRYLPFMAGPLPVLLPLLRSLKKEVKIMIYDIPDEMIPEMAYLFGILCYLQSYRKKISADKFVKALGDVLREDNKEDRDEKTTTKLENARTA